MFENRLTSFAVNAVDKYCNVHEAPWRSEAERVGLVPHQNDNAAAPKDLSGTDRLNISNAALSGLADWLEGQEAYNIATDSLGDDGPRSHAEAILISLREKILKEAAIHPDDDQKI